MDHKRRAPAIPDLRFEQSFMKSIQQYNEDGTVKFQWKNILWVAVRDQVISPWLQGSLWAIAVVWLTPYSAQISRRIRAAKEGLGAVWLRRQVQTMGLSTGANSGWAK
ncbi:hypothetical protein C8J56DRAFT_916422 [Mycena floridula]|nr:hypothetical protein C8J56DRAFT_916422 [Mycena floridula]